MSLGDLSVLTALKSKMRWHQTRQTVLAENVANADTPGFRARDVRMPEFASLLQGGTDTNAGMRRTNTMHLGGFAGQAAEFRPDDASDYEITPEGNAVSLEGQMMKVAENQMDYQLATTLYSKGLGLLRTAISRRG